MEDVSTGVPFCKYNLLLYTENKYNLEKGMNIVKTYDFTVKSVV